MENSLWFANQRTTALQLLRQSLRWHDAAASTINTRYLNPHESDSADMLHAFKEQHNTLEVVSSQVKTAKVHMIQAGHANDELEKHHRYVMAEMNRASQEYEQGRRFESLARGKIPSIFQLIANANTVG